MDIKNSLTQTIGMSIHRELEKSIRDCKTLLDLGCGSNSILRQFDGFYTVGVDVFEDAIQKSKQKKIHDEYYIKDVLDFLKDQDKDSFDAVIAIDLIEHLEKEEGKELIKEMERVGRKRTVIFTPNGFVEQEPYEGNPYQVHRSGWRVADFKKRNYRVKGISGYYGLRGQINQIKYRPKRFFFLLSFLTQFIVKHIPTYAAQLFCVKELRAI